MAVDKVFYNQASAAKLGWEPSWFGEKHFDSMLVRAIKKWQKQRGLVADGMCGPTTFRRLWTERRSAINETKRKKTYSNHIINDGEFHPIDWDKVVLWTDEGGLKAKPGTYYDYTGKPKRKIKQFVNHWDACLSSKSCQDVLDKRGLSVHFLIDNDGTIYQTLDMQHAAWHAGNANRFTVGVEISNAYYTKYQDWYVKNGFGERPIISDGWVQGNKLSPFLGFYPVQLEALKQLWKAFHRATNVSLRCPLNENGTLITKYDPDVAYGRFTGIVNHYNISKNKSDCAGLDLIQLLKEVNSE